MSDNRHELITETVKKGPYYKGKLFRYVSKTIILGVIFGVVSSLTFIGICKLNGITDIKNNPEGNLRLADDNLADEPRLERGVVGRPINSNKSKDSLKNEKGHETENNAVTGASVNKNTIIADENSFSDYLKNVSKKIKGSILELQFYKNDEEWYNNVQHQTGTGLVIAESGESYYIITNTNFGKDIVNVVFDKKAHQKAKVVGKDKNTGISILSIQKDQISHKIKKRIKLCKIGYNSLDMVGEPALFYGNIGGQIHSFIYGNIISSTNTDNLYDGEYLYLTGDVMLPAGCNGVICDLKGNITGILISDNDISLAHGIGITELMPIVNKILNDKPVVSLGIRCHMVSKDIDIQGKKTYYKGLFVKDVADNSSAYKAGIRPGDIIVSFNGEQINDMGDLKSILSVAEKNEKLRAEIIRKGIEDHKLMNVDITLF